MDVIGIAVADAASFFLPPPSFSIIFRLIQTPELGRLWEWKREEERKGGAPPRTVGPTTLKKYWVVECLRPSEAEAVPTLRIPCVRWAKKSVKQCLPVGLH